MRYIEKELYEGIETRLLASAIESHYTDNGHVKPVTVRQFNDDYDSDGGGQQPYNRPAVFVEFGEYELQDMGGYVKGPVPITLHVVQDNYNQSGNVNATQEAKYQDKLKYPSLIQELLHQYRISNCILDVKQPQKLKEQKNLLVFTVLIIARVRVSRRTISESPALSAPSIIAPPSISGIETEGQTLVATAGASTGNPTPSITWQWTRSGSDISGATASSYQLQPDDVGETITVVQTVTNSQGSDSSESNATSQISSTTPSVLIPEFIDSTNSDTYDAFGQVVYVEERSEIHHIFMQGTSHVTQGKVMHRVYDVSTDSWGVATPLFTPTGDFHYTGISAGKLDGKLWVFFSRFDPNAGAQGEHDLLQYASSTDLTGNTWNALQQFSFPSIAQMPRHNFYGKMVYGEDNLTAYVFWLQHELPVLNGKIRAIKTIDGGNNWTDIEIHEAFNAGDVLTEIDVTKVAPNKFIGLVRSESGLKLHASITSTGIENFPDFSITNLGFDNLNGQFPMIVRADNIAVGSVTHTKMAATAYDDESDEAIGLYLDRATGNIYLSKTPTGQLEADPTDWNAPVLYYDNRPNEFLKYFTSFRGGLGYPSIAWTGRRISGKKEWMVVFGQESEKSGKCDLIYALDNFTAYPTIEVLYPPESLDITVNANDMELSWPSVIGADEYEVWKTTNYFDSNTEDNWQLVTTVSATNYTDAIDPLDRVWYKVRAIGSGKYPSVFTRLRYGFGNGTPVQNVEFTEALGLSDALSGTLASSIIANNIGTGDFTFITVVDGPPTMAASGGNSFIGFLNLSYLFSIQTNQDVRHFVNGSLRYNTASFPTDVQMMIVRRESGVVKIQYNTTEVYNQSLTSTDATGQTFNLLPNPVPDGRIFMFGCWNRSITDNEVLSMVNGGDLLKPQQSIIDSSCLALYYFETDKAIVNGSNLELQDQSSNNNHININGLTGADASEKKTRYDSLIEII